MKNENFAERLFCDLRNAEVKIHKPFYSEGGSRAGENNIDQFNIIGKRNLYSISKGARCDLDCKLTFTEAYQILLNNIIEMKEVKFYSLATPQKGPELARLEEFEKVVTRYVKDYFHETDDVIERWDVLVQKVIENV